MKKRLFTTLLLMTGCFIAKAQYNPASKTVVSNLQADFSSNFRNQYMAEEDSVEKKDATYYMTKSRNQKAAAWVLVGLGGASIIAGAIVSAVNTTEDVYNAFTLQYEERNTDLENTLIIAGGAVALTSIPLFIASARNKHKARLMPKTEKAYGLPINTSGIAGMTISIPIGR